MDVTAILRGQAEPVSRPARILVVEDERVVAMGLRKQLQALGYEIAGQAATGEAAIQIAEERRPDLVLMDIHLEGEMDGVQAATSIRDRLCIPVIYLTAYSSRDILDRAKVTEPFGYVLKPYEDRELHVAIEVALYKHRADQRLRESEQRYRTTFKSVGYGIIVIDTHGQVILLNPAAERVTGWRQAEAAGKPLETVFPLVDHRDRMPVLNPFRAALQPDSRPRLEPHCLLVTRDGRELHIEDSTAPIMGEDCCPTRGTVLAFRDVTESRRLDQAYQQSQKTEMLGLLAGGIAHDFNNLLTPILGYATLLKNRMGHDSAAVEMAKAIEIAAESAAQLTRQMLAYAGQGRFVILPLDLSLLVEEMGVLLLASVSKKVELHYHLPVDLPAIEGDSAQVRQVILNLLLNASEACGESEGTIHVSTRLVHATDADLSSPFVPETPAAGDYVVLRVSDSGCGIPEAALGRIFDPFFTTKSAGRGLGLAAVLGIMRGHKGTLHVNSILDRGTTFDVFFRASSRRPKAAAPESVQVEAVQGTVLVAEDMEAERTLIEHILVEAGLRVISVRDGWEAVVVFARRRDEIGCVLLDMTMPRLSGVEALTEIRSISPKLPAVMMTGYTVEDLTKRLARQAVVGIVQKPFLPDQLVNMLRTALKQAANNV